MTGQFFFTTVAGLALSVAGFASLVTALRREGRWSRTSLWRLRAIVGESLTMTLVAILPLPVYYATGADEPLTIRIISGALALRFLLSLRRALRDEWEWGRRYVIQAALLRAIQLALQLTNVWLGSLPLLMIGFVWWLLFPIQLLYRVINDFQPPIDEE
ncbi:MAG TPA: hypothetical protein VGT60_03690 [Candidatus Limnocylindria bacterium]|nr:hypothetical protein [Candidatus Limnocylindria bacterium]